MSGPIAGCDIACLTCDDPGIDDLGTLTQVRLRLVRSDGAGVAGPGGTACVDVTGQPFGPLLREHGTTELFTVPGVPRDRTADRGYPSGRGTDPGSVADWIRSLTRGG
ncbi:MAG: hypothetical protein WAX14_19205 [Rhodococcus sp. (in: high G+C Gram-positive bacteria)]|uniref:hypothetical protein n=1 Tax=Rhodococcus sp. TaxID=1831 RepID=UPI003BB5EFE6